MTSKADEFLKNIEKNIILRHISVDEFNDGGFAHYGQFIALKDISKEIRLKSTKLCEGLFHLKNLLKNLEFIDLMIVLRYQVMQILNNVNFHHKEIEPNCFLSPSSLDEEEMILDYCLKILKSIRSKLTFNKFTIYVRNYLKECWCLCRKMRKLSIKKAIQPKISSV